MRIDNQLTDEALLAELGQRLRQTRLDQNRTQGQLAESAGVSKRTIERLESGESVQLTGFLRVCRELNLVSRFELLLPPSVPSPLAQVKLQGKARRRASSAREPGGAQDEWTWSDDE